MKSITIATPSWKTSSFGGTADTSPMELSALGEHLGHCRETHGHLFALHCLLDRMNGFVSARFVTTLMVVVLLIGVSGLML